MNIFRNENLSKNVVPNYSKKREAFLDSIRIKEDPDKVILLKIQDDIEKSEMNQEVIYGLTKNLTEDQKNKLLNLYEKQIEKYEISIENHKNNILAMRKKMG